MNNNCISRSYGKLAWISVVVLALASISHGGIFNVRTYGATGNGSTDDTDEIQDAIDAAEAASGTNIVYFPANNDGTPAIYLTSLLEAKTDVWLQGCGRLTTLKLINQVSPALVTPVIASSSTGISNFRVRSLTIDGNKANNDGSVSGLTACAIFVGGRDIVIEGNYIYNSREAGIVLGVNANVADQTNNSILNNWVHNPGKYNGGWGAIAVISGTGTTIRGNMVTTDDNNMHWAINVEPNGDYSVSGITIANNLVRGAVMVQGPGDVYGATIKDNDVDATLSAGGPEGIRVHDTDGTILISNNTITPNQYNSGIDLTNVSNPTVTTNLIGNVGSSRIGVTLLNVSSGTMTSNRISARGGTSSTVGFSATGSTSGITYTSNEYSNISSGTP